MNIRRIKKQANKQTNENKKKKKEKKEQCRLSLSQKTQQNKKIGPTAN